MAKLDKTKTNKMNGNIKNSAGFIIAGLIGLLILSNLATFFYCKKSNQKSAASVDLNLLNPARKFIKQEDMIINFQPLRDYLNGKYENDQNVSIYFEFLNTGANISINKDAQFWGASMLKVPVAMAVAKKIEKGEWRWEDKLVLMPTDKDDQYGNLYEEKTGTSYMIDDLVRRSVAESDNTANFMLLRNLEVAEVNDVYSHIGLQEFLSKEGEISAKKYSVIFRSLYNSTYLSDENSQKLIKYLSETEFNQYLQSALPADMSFAHKIGVAGEKSVILDSGIVYFPNRPYLLTVMIKSESEQSAKAMMMDISGQVYQFIKDYQD